MKKKNKKILKYFYINAEILLMRSSITGVNVLMKHPILESNLILTRLLKYGKEIPYPLELPREQ